MAAESDPGKALRAHSKQYTKSAGQSLIGNGLWYCSTPLTCNICVFFCPLPFPVPVLPG